MKIDFLLVLWQTTEKILRKILSIFRLKMRKTVCGWWKLLLTVEGCCPTKAGNLSGRRWTSSALGLEDWIARETLGRLYA